MGSVRRNARGPSKFVARCSLAAILGVAQSGCAGLGTVRHGDYPFLGGFWDYGRPTETFPGGDAYAQQMNDAKAKAADRQARAEQDANRTADKPDKAGETKDKKDPAARPDGAGAGDDNKPRLTSNKARGDQNAIRVTLGRPESLPTIAGMPQDAPSKSLMASAAPKWKKESSEEDGSDEGRHIRLAPEPARVADARPELSDEPELDEPAPRSPEPKIVKRTPYRPSQTDRSGSELADARGIPRDLGEPPQPSEAPALAKSNEEQVREILDRAQARLKSIDSYQVAMSRVERVNGKLQPQEDVVLSIRRAPQAVRLQWNDGPNKGREVIYSTAVNDRLIHVNMANAAIPLPRMSIAVDSPLIMKNSRHSIKEAGFDTILAHMSDASSGTADQAKGSSGGTVTYKGVVKSPGIDRPCHRFVRQAPNGEKWEVLLDSKSLLPRSVVAQDARGELLERYTYRDLRENPVELASADAFDPDARWGKSKGLFSRLAGAAASVGSGSSAESTTR